MGKRILSRRRGAAPPRMVSPSHLHKGDIRYPVNWKGNATVAFLEHAPGRTAMLATLKLENGDELKTLANEGMSLGQQVVFTDTTQITINQG